MSLMLLPSPSPSPSYHFKSFHYYDYYYFSHFFLLNAIHLFIILLFLLRHIIFRGAQRMRERVEESRKVKDNGKSEEKNILGVSSIAFFIHSPFVAPRNYTIRIHCVMWFILFFLFVCPFPLKIHASNLFPLDVLFTSSQSESLRFFTVWRLKITFGRDSLSRTIIHCNVILLVFILCAAFIE